MFLAISAAISGIQAQSGRRTQESRGLVLNTAVLYGRAARELWILDVDDPTPQLEAAWTKRKHIVHEEYIIAHIPSTVIGGDTLLRDNPVCFLVQNGRDTVEIPAITVNVSLPVQHPLGKESNGLIQDGAMADSSSQSEQ